MKKLEIIIKPEKLEDLKDSFKVLITFYINFFIICQVENHLASSLLWEFFYVYRSVIILQRSDLRKKALATWTYLPAFPIYQPVHGVHP